MNPVAAFSSSFARRIPLVIVAAILATWPAFLALVAVNVAERPPVIVDVDGGRVLDGASSPRQQTRAITLNAATATALVPLAYTSPTSGFCIASSTTQSVYLTTEGATSTAQATGPFCADAALCPAGAIVPLAGRAWGILGAGAPLAITCSFVDDGVGFGQGARGANTASPDPACELTGGTDCAMTGPVRLDQGTQALPSITLEGDAATGWYRNGTDGYGNARWAWSSGGTQRLQMESHVAGSMVLSMPGAYSSFRAGAAGSSSEPNYGFTGGDGGMWRESGSEFRVGTSRFFRWVGSNILVNNVAAVAPDSSEGSALGTSNLPWQRVMVGAGTTADPSVQVGDEDAGLYYDDGNNVLFVQSPGSDSTTGSVAIVADTDGTATISAGGTLALKVGNGTAATGSWLIGTNDSVNVGIFQLPRSVSTAPAQPSALFCDVSRSGFVTYYDDTNDTVRGRVCVCTSDGGTPETYSWRDLSDMTTACP